jgi:hypothetical protein
MRFHRHPDGGGVVEGTPGTAISAEGETFRLAAGWRATADMTAQGYEVVDEAEPAVPPGFRRSGPLRVEGGHLAQTLQPVDLTGPQLDSFIRRAGLSELVAAAVAAAQASESEDLRYAAGVLTRGSVFRFDETLASAAAAISLLGVEQAPDFADPETLAGLAEHWRDAATQGLPASPTET